MLCRYGSHLGATPPSLFRRGRGGGKPDSRRRSCTRRSLRWALQLGEFPAFRRVVGKFVVGENGPWNNVRSVLVILSVFNLHGTGFPLLPVTTVGTFSDSFAHDLSREIWFRTLADRFATRLRCLLNSVSNASSTKALFACAVVFAILWGLFAINREISVCVRLRGGAGRTRTSNQTVICRHR
jgi:hypothetical protein